MNPTKARKLEHIEIVLREKVEGWASTWLDDVMFVHQALPEADLGSVDLEVEFLGKTLSAPLMITGMTGGHPDTVEINRALARVAEELRVALGVGSQRAAIEDPSLEYTFSVAREEAPSIPLVANLGAVQLAKGYGVREVLKAVEMIEADAIALHLNPAQEAFQPEGDTEFSGLIDRICSLAEQVDVPIMVKETGAGLSAEVVRPLYECGIKLFDTAGAGGTSWVAVEMYRAAKRGLKVHSRAAGEFLSWGIPTAASIVEVRSTAPDSTIVGSGGIRSGLDAAKAIALGADVAGFARPALQAVVEGGMEGLRLLLDTYVAELRTAAFLAGCGDYGCLRRSRILVRGRLREWMVLRGLEPESYLAAR